MKKEILITSICCISFLVGCFESPDSIKNGKDNSQKESSEPLEMDKELNEEDCVFDLATQTDDFLKEIPEFSNYVWDNDEKKATIQLDNGNTLLVTRGGCAHYSYYGNLILKNSELNLNDESEIFKNAIWIAKKLFHESDVNFIQTSLNNKNFELQQTENQKYYTFQTDTCCGMTLIVEKINTTTISIEIGYYMC